MPIINAEITETTNITENGTYNVAKYTTANVKTPIAGYKISEGVASKSDYVFVGDEFDNVTEIGNSTFKNAFYDAGVSGIVNFSNVQTIGNNALHYAFSGANITEFRLSGIVGTNSALAYAFSNNVNLNKLDFSGLTTISGNSAFNYAFDGCTSLKSVTFPDLTTITSNCFSNTFKNTGLKFLSFPALTTVPALATTDCFNNMLTGVTGCIVVFPAAIEADVKKFSSYSKGFGGTNTVIMFGDIKMLPVTIPSGWTVLTQSGSLTDGEDGMFVIGNNYLFANDGFNHYATINFVVTNATTEFVFDPNSISYNTLTLQSNVAGTTYKTINLWSSGDDYTKEFDNITLQPTMYFTSDYFVNVQPEKEGYLCVNQYAYMTSSVTLTFNMQQPTVLTYTASDLLSNLAITSGYEDKYTVNNGQLVIHTDNTALDQFSGGLTLPSGASVFKISGSALVSSEANYDFGYIYFDTTQQTFSYTQIKNNNTDNVIFKQSGENNTTTSFESEFYADPLTTYVLTIGWAQDRTIKGDNTMWVDPITIEYV